MGVAPLFCCFKKQSPLCVAITAIVANIISFSFMIWGVADLLFEKDGVEAIYVIGFVIILLCLILFIIILIFLTVCKNSKKMTFNHVGKLLCLIILVSCGIAFIFILIAFIIDLKDYDDANDEYKEVYGKSLWRSKDWAVAIVPALIALICLVIMALCANYLFRVFKDIISLSSSKVNQSTESSNIPQQKQNELFPNNKGKNYPVKIYQNEKNYNNK